MPWTLRCEGLTIYRQLASQFLRSLQAAFTLHHPCLTPYPAVRLNRSMYRKEHNLVSDITPCLPMSCSVQMVN